MLESFVGRIQRVSRDPSRIVDYLRAPRKLVRGSPVANRLGLQALRAVKEQVVWSLRPSEAAPHLQAHLETLDRDGFVVIPDFLPESSMSELEADLEAIERLPKDQFNLLDFGPNYASRMFMVSKRPEYSAFARHLRDNDFIYDLARALARRDRSYRPHVMLQWLYKPEPGKPHEDFEYNSYLHVDRHYPFLKAFFYLRDVPDECAPYTFVRGSHKFNWDRLRFEYLLGVRQSEARANGFSATEDQKSRDRVMEELASELKQRMGLEEVRIAGKRNTLIISNNQGLHRRSEMRGDGARVTANLDFKFFESPAHKLYPILRHIEAPSAKALAY